jgi:hypothetical protein
MSEIILAIILAALIVERFMFARQTHKQQDHYMNALIAKNTNEFISMRETESKPSEPMKDIDEVPLDQASDDTFDKFIKNTT